MDRLGPRRLILIGGILLAVGLVASAFANALWQVIVLYGVVMTLGANCLGLVVFVPILSRRFVRNRGMAVAVVQSANGFARAVSAPLSQVLIAGLGWRGAYLAQGGFMAAAFLPLAALFRRSEPERHRPPAVAPSTGAGLDPAPRDPHAAFLAAVPGLRVHRSRQLPGGAASARLRRHHRLRQALRGRGAGAWRASCRCRA